jgi:SET domain-containing protein
MLIVETYLAESSGKGIGLFAKNIIPKGTIWWIRNENFDKLINQEKLNSYDDLAIAFITNYGFLEPTQNWYLCIDNARFSNHSDVPNSINNLNTSGEIISCSAIKDIPADEEILCNYRETCLTCLNNLGFENEELL